MFVKEKNPGIPSHKVVKKPATAPTTDGQENASANKPKLANKPGNVSIHGASATKGSFDPLAALGGSKLKNLKKLKDQQGKPGARP